MLGALAADGGGLTFAADLPGAGPVAIERASLDELQGQPVDIAPWAYAWRADRAVQERPEAHFIPRRLDRIDTVYRPALGRVGAAGLRSEHYDMPDLITPLPPRPRGRLLAGLLWSVRLADYRLELCWPAGQEIPSPDAVEVRVYPTAFGWFGWCNDEILGQPEISADRRTWIYHHSGVPEIPTVVGRTHRRGSATEMVAVFCDDEKTSSAGKTRVPGLRLISPTVGTWKRMDVEIEWGFQSGSEKADLDGRLESDLSLIGPVSPLAGDMGTKVTGSHAWRSRAAGEGRRGIVLPLAYVPGDRRLLETPTVTRSVLFDTTGPGPKVPDPTLDSRVTLWTKTGGVTFRPVDVEKGPVMIPEHGLFIVKAGSGKTARQFAAELAVKNLKSIRQSTREHREAASWDELLREARLWRCPEGTAFPPFPEVPDPPMQVRLSDARWTDAWRAASHQLRGRHMWGGLAFEVGRVARQMDMVGLHDEADKVYQHFLNASGAKADGDYSDGDGALEWATSVRHGMGYSHDGTHASTGRLLFGMAERYFLTGDREWFQRHRARLQAAADWIIRQRHSYMKDVPNRQDLLVAGLMPPLMLGDYALPSSDWRWYYCDNAFSLQGLQRFADALADFDAEAGRKYRAEAEAFRRDIRRAVEREAALSPVRIGRDGVYRSFVPIAAYTRGLMMALEYPSVGRPQGDVILGALPLAEPFAALDANDARMVGTLDVMEEVGTSASAVRELEEARKTKGLSAADAWFWTSYGASLPKASHNANIYLLQDDVPNFLRFWMNSYAIMVFGDGKMSEWGAWSHYAAQCEHPDNGTAGWFLENFRNLLVMQEGTSLWIARGTPRPWLESGKRISVKNAPTSFGTVAYEIASDADRGTIAATIEIPSRQPPQTVRVRLRHPQQLRIRSVTVNGQDWKGFNPDKEVIELVGLTGRTVVVASY
ncbi:MAG: hypothetical protein FJ288_17950 [Planctomycetes bacterium]|nr:hypothetical protein [Planctomycetota bacterium]